MEDISQLFSKELNKDPESNYGSTRSTLFGKFYERILAVYIETELGYKMIRKDNDNSVSKPRIYWKKVSGKQKGDWLSQQRIEKSLKRKVSHCTPDGVFKKGGKYYIWEAKNWPLYPEKGPIPQLKNYFEENPWIFANLFTVEGKEHYIDSFLFSFWDMEDEEKTFIKENINQAIGKGKFKLLLTKPILEECIKNQYEWYLNIVKQEKKNVDRFFKQLLGK